MGAKSSRSSACLHLTDSLYTPHTQILWIEGRNLMDDSGVWVPYEMVHLNYTLPLPTGHGCFFSSSNGLASSNHLYEPMSHGICEVVERDSTILWHLLDSDESGDDPRRSRHNQGSSLPRTPRQVQGRRRSGRGFGRPHRTSACRPPFAGPPVSTAALPRLPSRQRHGLSSHRGSRHIARADGSRVEPIHLHFGRSR